MSERYENWKELKPLTAPVAVGTRCVVIGREHEDELELGDIVEIEEARNAPFCNSEKGRFCMCIEELARLPSEEPAKAERKIVHIATDPRGTAVLCNDGTAWYMSNDANKWSIFPQIPQDAV